MQKNLFIIDDDEVDRYLIKRIASKSKLDLRIWEYESGQAFADAVEQPDPELTACMQDGSVSLMLIDINMPGMNGFEVVHGIRDSIDQGRLNQNALAILICSSSEHPNDRAAAEKDPLIRQYIVKPPGVDRLIELIATYCVEAR